MKPLKVLLPNSNFDSSKKGCTALDAIWGGGRHRTESTLAASPRSSICLSQIMAWRAAADVGRASPLMHNFGFRVGIASPSKRASVSISRTWKYSSYRWVCQLHFAVRNECSAVNFSRAQQHLGGSWCVGSPRCISRPFSNQNSRPFVGGSLWFDSQDVIESRYMYIGVGA